METICAREDCGHALEDHEDNGNPNYRPCNVRGATTHCICYAYTTETAEAEWRRWRDANMPGGE